MAENLKLPSTTFSLPMLVLFYNFATKFCIINFSCQCWFYTWLIMLHRFQVSIKTVSLITWVERTRSGKHHALPHLVWMQIWSGAVPHIARLQPVSGEVGPAEKSTSENSALRGTRPPENSAPSAGELGPISWRTRHHSVAVWHGLKLLCVFQLKLILLSKCYRYNWNHKCLLGFGPMHWPNNFVCLVGW